MKRAGRRALGGVLILLCVGAAGVWYARRPSKGHPSAMVPADSSLVRDWLYYYPSHRTEAARGFVVLFGNDVSFWEPHQDLAWRIADDGYAVLGIDLRKFLATLPEREPQRDSAFAVAMPLLIQRARHAMNADSMPLIVGGHSFGAELAIWLAAYRPPDRLKGVLLLNTRSSGHLFITAHDWMNEEASGPYSFSTIELVTKIDPRVRIALVRSEKDKFKQHDPDFIKAGGSRLRRFVIPMAAHSLTSMLIAAPLVSRAVRFLSDTTALNE